MDWGALVLLIRTTGLLHNMQTTNEPIVYGMNCLQQYLQLLLLIILQSHSAVYCGNQQRSYHGTTVQVVQCNSLLKAYHDDRMSTSIVPSSTLTELSTDQFADPTGTSKCNLE